MLTWDIESDGLVHQLTHIKCLNVFDDETGLVERYTDSEYYEEPVTKVDEETGKVTCVGVVRGNPTKRTGTIADGLKLLADAPIIAGQNIIGFDIPALQKIYPDWKPNGIVLDSLVMSRVMYTNLYDLD